MRNLQTPSDAAAPKLALVAVGSNVGSEIGAPETIVREAILAVESRVKDVATVSRFFRTPAFPAGSGPDFVNAAFSIPWDGEARGLLDLLHEIEAEFGRTRRVRWAARVLDLDLLALGDTVLPDPERQTAWREIDPATAAEKAPEEIILPHPRLQERAFVLVPLSDVAPDWRHPITGRTVAEMLAALPAGDTAEIVPLKLDPGALSIRGRADK